MRSANVWRFVFHCCDPAPALDGDRWIEVLREATVAVGPMGYRRTIRQGSVWTRVGRVSQGEVYKPTNQVFMVEGTHVHEAYLVLDGDQVVGFYLPVERAFAPSPDEKKTTLTIRRRDP